MVDIVKHISVPVDAPCLEPGSVNEVGKYSPRYLAYLRCVEAGEGSNTDVGKRTADVPNKVGTDEYTYLPTKLFFFGSSGAVLLTCQNKTGEGGYGDYNCTYTGNDGEIYFTKNGEDVKEGDAIYQKGYGSEPIGEVNEITDRGHYELIGEAIVNFLIPATHIDEFNDGDILQLAVYEIGHTEAFWSQRAFKVKDLGIAHNEDAE